MSETQAKLNANRSAERMLRFALLLLITCGNMGLVACGPVIRCLANEIASVLTPFEEGSETLTETANSSENDRESQRTRRSLPHSSRSLNHLLSRFRMDRAAVSPALVNASGSRPEFELINGCGATLRC
jgi:hypothetical protein